jgi:hypothetical protein
MTEELDTEASRAFLERLIDDIFRQRRNARMSEFGMSRIRLERR